MLNTFNELFECRLAGLRNEGFLEENLVYQAIDISPMDYSIFAVSLTQG
jgi:hypothetical protein